MGIFLLLMLLFLGVCGLSSSSVPRQFHVVKEKRNWTAAQQYCREEFTDLATVNGTIEMERLKSVVRDAGVEEAWIGLKYEIEAQWRWSLADQGFYGDTLGRKRVSDRPSVTPANETEFRNWAPGEPGHGESCALIMGSMGGLWNNYPCHELFPFLCYDGRNSTHPYVLVEGKKTWAGAQRYCREKHTDLVSVRNQAENDWLTGITGPDRKTWIGLFRDDWEWSDGGSSSFRHWGPWEPHYGWEVPRVCAHVKASGSWGAEDCTQPASFICRTDLKGKRTQMVRVEMETSDDVNMEDPDVQKAFLQQIRDRLKSQGFPGDVQLSWEKQPDGKFFHKKNDKKKEKRDEL